MQKRKCKHPGCNLHQIKGDIPIDSEGYCLFHSNDIRWKRKQGLVKHFRELVEEAGIQNKELDFTGSKFAYSQDEFNTRKIFNDLVFKTVTKFNNSIFYDQAYFKRSIFEQDIFFKEVRFGESKEEKLEEDINQSQQGIHADNAHFKNCFFKSVADFEGSVINNQAIFKYDEKEAKESPNFRYEDFKPASFSGRAIFANVHFVGQVYFGGTEFFDEAYFRFSHFYHHEVQFWDTIFYNEVNFRDCTLEANAKLNFEWNHDYGLNSSSFQHKKRDVDKDYIFKSQGVNFEGLNMKEKSEISFKTADLSKLRPSIDILKGEFDSQIKTENCKNSPYTYSFFVHEPDIVVKLLIGAMDIFFYNQTAGLKENSLYKDLMLDPIEVYPQVDSQKQSYYKCTIQGNLDEKDPKAIEEDYQKKFENEIKKLIIGFGESNKNIDLDLLEIKNLIQYRDRTKTGRTDLFKQIVRENYEIIGGDKKTLGLHISSMEVMGIIPRTKFFLTGNANNLIMYDKPTEIRESSQPLIRINFFNNMFNKTDNSIGKSTATSLLGSATATSNVIQISDTDKKDFFKTLDKAISLVQKESSISAEQQKNLIHELESAKTKVNEDPKESANILSRIWASLPLLGATNALVSLVEKAMQFFG